MTSALTERVQARAYERRWWILVVLCFSLLVIVLDNSILNVALPSIVRELHATNSQLQWMVDSYTLVFAGLLLTMGSIGDKYGRRPALQAGFAIFGVGSLLSALAGSPNLAPAGGVSSGPSREPRGIVRLRMSSGVARDSTGCPVLSARASRTYSCR